MNALIHRVVHGALWVKLVPLGLVLAGMGEEPAAIITFAIVLVLAARNLRDGIREQYIEPPLVQAARLMKNLVYDNGVWVNPETPEQGIERLAGPYRVTPRRHAPHELAMGGR